MLWDVKIVPRQIFGRGSKCSRHYEKSFSNNNSMYRTNDRGSRNVHEISRLSCSRVTHPDGSPSLRLQSCSIKKNEKKRKNSETTRRSYLNSRPIEYPRYCSGWLTFDHFTELNFRNFCDPKLFAAYPKKKKSRAIYAWELCKILSLYPVIPRADSVLELQSPGL